MKVSEAAFKQILFLSNDIILSIGLPGAMQTVSLFLPGTLACESKFLKIWQSFLIIMLIIAGIRAILLRGWGFSYYTVWIGFVSTSGWICVYVILTYVIYTIRK